MRFWLYNLGWRLLGPLIPWLLARRTATGKEIKSRIAERYGNAGAAPVSPGMIWLHAVSVGETVAALGLVEALAARRPEAHFLITTNTVTAASMVEKAAGKMPQNRLYHRFQPLDHPAFVDRFLATYRPVLAIFLESDFWPNLITRSAQSGVPVVFASSQMSDTAFARWQGRPTVARQLFATPQRVLAVNSEQASRFRRLGTAADRITVIGSLKGVHAAAPNERLCQQLMQAIGQRRLFLAASTHAGEDAPVIAAAQQLGQDWLTIIAPRHPDRGDAIASLAGGAPQFSRHAMPGPHDSVFVMDVLGEMASLFSLADVVFLGASLVPNGGHNPLEPAQFGRPIITGPHIFKNSAEFGGLRAAGVVFDLDYDTADTAAAALAALVMGIAADKAGLKKIHKNALDYAATAAKRADTAAAAISRLIDPPRR